MTSVPALIRQRSGNSVLRRIRYWASRLAGARLQKSQKMYFVTINGQRFKRMLQPDAYTAARIEEALTRFGASDRIPGLAVVYEREVWVDFIDGERPGRVDETLVLGIADFFAILNAKDPRLVPATETRFPDDLVRNLEFLHKVGVLEDEAYRDLRAAVDVLTPDSLWVGFDYTDAVLKNFIVAADDGRICAIDVESIFADALIGMSFAKASERWMSAHREVFLDQLNRPGVPDYRPYLAFVELHFLAHWMKRAFVEQKWKFVDAAKFERFRSAAPSR